MLELWHCAADSIRHASGSKNVRGVARAFSYGQIISVPVHGSGQDQGYVRYRGEDPDQGLGRAIDPVLVAVRGLVREPTPCHAKEYQAFVQQAISRRSCVKEYRV